MQNEVRWLAMIEKIGERNLKAAVDDHVHGHGRIVPPDFADLDIAESTRGYILISSTCMHMAQAIGIYIFLDCEL